MRIGLTTHTFVPEFIGGRERHVESLASVLGKDNEVTVFAGSNVRRITKEEKEAYTLYRIPMFPVPVSKNPRQYYRIIPKFLSVMKREKLDVVHAHEYRHFSTDAAAAYARKTKTPMVMTVHGYQVTNKLGKMIVDLYDKTRGRYSLDTAKRIICVSRIQERDLQKWTDRKAIGEKVIVIPNGVIVNDFSNLKPNDEIGKKYGLDNKKVILSVGRLLYRKGFHDLINASGAIIEKNPDVRIVIIGPDHGERKNLEAMIKDRRLEENCVLLGPGTSDVVNHFLSICKVFVIPSLYEGLPTTLLEAMAAGKPVVGSNIESIAEVITDRQDGLLVPAGSPTKLADKVNILLADEKLSMNLGGKAKESVRKYDWKGIAKDVRGVYEEAVV